MQTRSQHGADRVRDARREMEGGGGRDRRSALPRCIALVEPLPVHVQLSLRSRQLIFLTSPLLLNLRLRLRLCRANGTSRYFSVP